jgi:hypothetical protein
MGLSDNKNYVSSGENVNQAMNPDDISYPISQMLLFRVINSTYDFLKPPCNFPPGLSVLPKNKSSRHAPAFFPVQNLYCQRY